MGSNTKQTCARRDMKAAKAHVIRIRKAVKKLALMKKLGQVLA